jgi:hypothetical protein
MSRIRCTSDKPESDNGPPLSTSPYKPSSALSGDTNALRLRVNNLCDFLETTQSHVAHVAEMFQGKFVFPWSVAC